MTSMKPWSRGPAVPLERQHQIVRRLDPTVLLAAAAAAVGGWSMTHTDGSPPGHVLESAGKTARLGEVAASGMRKP